MENPRQQRLEYESVQKKLVEVEERLKRIKKWYPDGKNLKTFIPIIHKKEVKEKEVKDVEEDIEDKDNS
tara:strand:- start:184 stop:390 length:207 start_codon:yes stop_codon:yes gene_type:complete